jgi:hypothetical protein
MRSKEFNSIYYYILPPKRMADWFNMQSARNATYINNAQILPDEIFR